MELDPLVQMKDPCLVIRVLPTFGQIGRWRVICCDIHQPVEKQLAEPERRGVLGQARITGTGIHVKPQPQGNRLPLCLNLCRLLGLGGHFGFSHLRFGFTGRRGWGCGNTGGNQAGY